MTFALNPGLGQKEKILTNVKFCLDYVQMDNVLTQWDHIDVSAIVVSGNKLSVLHCLTSIICKKFQTSLQIYLLLLILSVEIKGRIRAKVEGDVWMLMNAVNDHLHVTMNVKTHLDRTLALVRQDTVFMNEITRF